MLGPKRAPSIPDIPTSVEAGFPDVQGVTFNGMFAPKATPPAVLEKLSAVIREALAKPAVIEKLASVGSEARGARRPNSRQFLAEETAKWTDVMQKANIKVKE